MLARLPAALLNPSRARAATNALPHFTGGKRPVGMTRHARGSTALNVIGSPSMRVLRETDGGTKTVLRRNMQHADLLSEKDLAKLYQLIEQVENTARSLSRGGLTRRDLRRMGHPYAKRAPKALGRLRGSGRGVSNLAITNRHSGTFERNWQGRILRDKSGVSLMLENETEYSAYLAFGTKRMRAHGPHTTAMAKHLSAIDTEWRRLGKVAASRNEALSVLGMAARERAGGAG